MVTFQPVQGTQLVTLLPKEHKGGFHNTPATGRRKLG